VTLNGVLWWVYDLHVRAAVKVKVTLSLCTPQRWVDVAPLIQNFGIRWG
jgi:hypothetical protein